VWDKLDHSVDMLFHCNNIHPYEWSCNQFQTWLWFMNRQVQWKYKTYGWNI